MNLEIDNADPLLNLREWEYHCPAAPSVTWAKRGIIGKPGNPDAAYRGLVDRLLRGIEA